MTTPEMQAKVDKIADLAAKLLHETARLRADIVRLHGRIVPFNNEQAVPDPPRGASHFKTLPEAIDGLAAARDAIAKAEYDLNAIRGVVDGISSHAISREEMQPWIKR